MCLHLLPQLRSTERKQLFLIEAPANLWPGTILLSSHLFMTKNGTGGRNRTSCKRFSHTCSSPMSYTSTNCCERVVSGIEPWPADSQSAVLPLHQNHLKFIKSGPGQGIKKPFQLFNPEGFRKISCGLAQYFIDTTS